MGKFLDLVEANRQRQHELQMKKRTSRNVVVGIVAAAAAVALGSRTTVKIHEHYNND